MSTFAGFMPEFPDIRVDYFRPLKDRRLPLACFLSHVHSDHLAGLESFRSPFIYCSPATKELLIRLEKRPHRLNLAAGIQNPTPQQYNHLKNLLKPIHLETPTMIELEPGNQIQVTLFDANHCTGAVMFLIEREGVAILYTGDIRSEPWFVNNLTRNPFLIEYTTGLKRLDCIYLDTSNIQPFHFPTKAEGLKELLEKIAKYPDDTVFHFSAWTFGYEEVWMALSKALKSQVHVVDYKLTLYKSLKGDPSGPSLSHEASVLSGYYCGNTPQAGYLTKCKDVRIHSCEKGTHCEMINDKTVWIRPIIARTANGEIGEIGVGGGGGDLNQDAEEFEIDDEFVSAQIVKMIQKEDDNVLGEHKRELLAGLKSHRRVISLDDLELNEDPEMLTPAEFLKAFARHIAKRRNDRMNASAESEVVIQGQSLPRTITFPYSRHSSYYELCDLLKAFNPKDIYPCTTDELNWDEDISMEHIFGKVCPGAVFRHDAEMRERQLQNQNSQQSQATSSRTSQMQSANAVESSSERKVTVLEENSQSKFIPVETQANSLSVSHEKTPSESSTTGAGSQGRRHKADVDDSMGSVKRPRIETDGPASSPVIYKNIEGRQATPFSEESSPEMTPSSDEGVDPNKIKLYHDVVDDVFRCTRCGHEAWGTASEDGFCTGCDVGEPAYFEVTGPEQRFPMGFVHTEYDSDEVEDPEEIKNILDDRMDDEESAYDTQDENNRLDEEYEQNSFIDDATVEEEEEEEEDSSTGEETDYKQKFIDLSASYNHLMFRHEALIEEHEDMRMDILGSDYDRMENDLDTDGLVDENGIRQVEISVPDPVLAEVVLGESQTSVISEEGVRNRDEASETVIGEGDWHNISMVSTANNHTHEEIEL